MERIDEAVASVETMDIMTSILLEVNIVMSWISGYHGYHSMWSEANDILDDMDISMIYHEYEGKNLCTFIYFQTELWHNMSKYEACESVNKNQQNFQTGAYHRKVPGFKPEMFKVGFF